MRILSSDLLLTSGDCWLFIIKLKLLFCDFLSRMFYTFWCLQIINCYFTFLITFVSWRSEVDVPQLLDGTPKLLLPSPDLFVLRMIGSERKNLTSTFVSLSHLPSAGSWTRRHSRPLPLLSNKDPQQAGGRLHQTWPVWRDATCSWDPGEPHWDDHDHRLNLSISTLINMKTNNKCLFVCVLHNLGSSDGTPVTTVTSQQRWRNLKPNNVHKKKTNPSGQTVVFSLK